MRVWLTQLQCIVQTNLRHSNPRFSRNSSYVTLNKFSRSSVNFLNTAEAKVVVFSSKTLHTKAPLCLYTRNKPLQFRWCPSLKSATFLNCTENTSGLVTSGFVVDDANFQMAENRYLTGYAKLGTSSCKKCKQKIDKGALRVAKLVSNPFSEVSWSFFRKKNPDWTFFNTKMLDLRYWIEGLADWAMWPNFAIISVFSVKRKCEGVNFAFVSPYF